MPAGHYFEKKLKQTNVRQSMPIVGWAFVKKKIKYENLRQNFFHNI